MERYWECKTTLEEENILRTFFCQKDVPAHLLPYKDVFTYEHDEPKTDCLDEEFDKKILTLIGEEAPKVHSIKLTQRLMPLFRAAAVVAIILTLGYALQVPFEENEAPIASNPTELPSVQGVSVAVGDTVSTNLVDKD